jgi:parallel beta-helix repeat protein
MKIKYLFFLSILLAIFWKFFVPLNVKERSRLPIIFIEYYLNKFDFDSSIILKRGVDTNLNRIFLSANSADPNIIQKAIDNINSGNIFLIDSVYYISSPILMKSNVYLIGRKEGTQIVNRAIPFSDVVQKSEKISDSIFIFNSKNKSDILGQNIFIGTHNSGGWNRAIFKIIKSKNKSYTAKLILNRSGFNVDKSNQINSQNSFVFMNDIKNSGLKNIEFSIYTNHYMSDLHRKDFLNSGIVIINSERIFLDSVKVNNYFGEGVSVQGGSKNYFSNLECKNNYSHGLHLGTLVKESLITNSNFSRNNGDGIYFCYQVSNCVIQNSSINENLENGLGGLGGAGDRGNIISSNIISSNLKSAIHLFETGNKISNNVFINNKIFKSNSEFGNLIYSNHYK